ncbi:MAG: type II toxin-antitoxin system ParD family antitoxin [Cyanobium sp.]
MVIKSSVSLRADQHAFARALVAGGRFPSVSAVVQQGLDLLKQQDADAQADRAALQALLLERADGPFFSAEDLRSALAAQRP